MKRMFLTISLLVMIVMITGVLAMCDDRDYHRGENGKEEYPPSTIGDAGRSGLELQLAPEQNTFIWPEPVVLTMHVSGSRDLPASLEAKVETPSGQQRQMHFFRGILYGTAVPHEGFYVGALSTHDEDGAYAVRASVECPDDDGDFNRMEAWAAFHLDGYAGKGVARPMKIYDLTAQINTPGCVSAMWTVPLNMGDEGSYKLFLTYRKEGDNGQSDNLRSVVEADYQREGGKSISAEICDLKPGLYDLKIVSTQQNGLSSAESNIYTVLIE